MVGIFKCSSLKEDEIDDLTENGIFDEHEIEQLYIRFRYLDRSNTGILTCSEFQMIPEIYGNPFSSLILSYIENNVEYGPMNFACFVDFLGLFSEKTVKEARIEFLFSLFDLEQNGRLTRSVLGRIYEILNGNTEDQESSLREEMVEEVLSEYDEGRKGYLSMEDFTRFYCKDKSLDRKMLIDFSREIRERKKMTFWDFIWPKNK
ncbi:serine/threonine-protein phosphatase 2B regulatory subunit [Pancytospora epiphaga]|nr:serine/threonine-protein phosphatase 2B regulatory subunit [Pancytospora epiphaga]